MMTRMKLAAILGLLFISSPVLAEETAQPAATPEASAAAPVDAKPKKTVAVLQNSKSIDELISASDVILMDVEKAPKDAITNPEDIVGKAPRRPLSAEQPIRPIDLKPFIVIRKGDMVTIQVQTQNMNLSAMGKALDNGATNDVIRVVNVNSNKTLFARVVSPTLVLIETANTKPPAP